MPTRLLPNAMVLAMHLAAGGWSKKESTAGCAYFCSSVSGLSVTVFGLTHKSVIDFSKRWLCEQVATAVALSHRTAGCLLVAVAMKASRWRDFLRRGFFPVVPRQHVVFLRVDLQDSGICTFPFDVFLHKVRPGQDGQAGLHLETLTSFCKGACMLQATDELVGLDDAGNPVFSPDMTALLKSVQAMALVTCLDNPTSLRKVLETRCMCS